MTRAGHIWYYNGGNEAARINSSGYVGIGTSGPTQNLQVNGVTRLNYFASGTTTSADNGYHVGCYVKSVSKNTWTNMITMSNREGVNLGRLYLSYSSSGTAGVAAYRFYTFYGATGVVVSEISASRSYAESISVQITTDGSDGHTIQVLWNDNGGGGISGPVNIVCSYEISSGGRDGGANYTFNLV